MGFVFVTELEDEDHDRHAVLTGRFAIAGHEDRPFASLSEAVEAARATAEHVHVEIEGVRYSVTGGGLHPPLAPEAEARAALGRRRWPGEEWLDRTELDEPIEWLMRLEVGADQLVRTGPARDAQAKVLDLVEECLAEAGFTDVFTSAGEIDAALDEIDEQAAAGVTRVTSSASGAFVVRACARARTWRAVVHEATVAAEDAIANAVGWPLHEAGWDVTATARPVESPPLRRPPV